MKKKILCFILCLVCLFPLCTLAVSADADPDPLIAELENLTIEGVPFDPTFYYKDSEDTDLHFLAIREEDVSSSGAGENFRLYVYLYNPSCREDIYNLTFGLCFDPEFMYNNSYPITYLMHQQNFVSGVATPHGIFTCSGTEKLVSENGLFLRYTLSCGGSAAGLANKMRAASNFDFSHRIYHFLSYCFSTAESAQGSSLTNWLTMPYDDSFVCTGTAGAEGYAASVYRSCCVDLDLHSTTWRSENPVSSSDRFHYNQVSSVYFSVPQEIYNDYDFIKSITANFWAYYSSPVIVTNSETFDNTFNVDGYCALYGLPLPDYYREDVPSLYDPSDRGLWTSPGGASGVVYRCYNPQDSVRRQIMNHDMGPWIIDTLSYYFYNPDISIDSDNHFYQAVSSSQFLNYVDYFSRINSGKKINGVHSDLFDDCEAKSLSYDKDDIYTLPSFEFNTQRSWWDALWGRNLGTASEEDIQQFVVIEDGNSFYRTYRNNVDEMCNDYKIGKEDAAGFLSFCAYADGPVVLLRFDVTEYECKELKVANLDIGNDQVWSCRQWFYHDVDVTHVTFSKHGQNFTYIVHADPIDVSGGIDVHNDIQDPEVISIARALGLFDKMQDFFGLFKQYAKIVLIVAFVLLIVWIVSKVIRILVPIGNRMRLCRLERKEKKKRRKRK